MKNSRSSNFAFLLLMACVLSLAVSFPVAMVFQSASALVIFAFSVVGCMASMLFID